jgi:hypothetical protein
MLCKSSSSTLEGSSTSEEKHAETPYPRMQALCGAAGHGHHLHSGECAAAAAASAKIAQSLWSRPIDLAVIQWSLWQLLLPAALC